MKEREKFCVWSAYSRFRCTLYSCTKQVQPYWTLCFVIRTRRGRKRGRKRTFYKLRIERPAIVTATFIHIGPNSWIEISKQGKIANINRMESNNKKRNFLRNVKLALRFCSLFHSLFVPSLSVAYNQFHSSIHSVAYYSIARLGTFFPCCYVKNEDIWQCDMVRCVACTLLKLSWNIIRGSHFVLSFI